MDITYLLTYFIEVWTARNRIESYVPESSDSRPTTGMRKCNAYLKQKKKIK